MSWFKRKPKNRRLGREHVLDVKLRSEQVRATRLRLAAIAMTLLFSTILGFYLVWRAGEWALDRLIYQNKAFAIQRIEVQTDGVIAVDQLRRWAGVKPGENLLALNLARVKRDLEMVSAIRSVAVERIMPGTLRLRVAEREPLAQIYVPRQQPNGAYDMSLLHLDEEGYVMALLEPRQRATPPSPGEESLPEIRGSNWNDVSPGRRVDSPQTRSALQLISAFERSPMAGVVDLQLVDVSSPGVLQVTTTQKSKITFATVNLDQQMGRWREIDDEARKVGKAVLTIDLSVSNNVPICLVDAGPALPTPAKNKTLQHFRKKNV